MTRITESAIEQLAIGRLEALGYRYVYAPGIAPVGSSTPPVFPESIMIQREIL